MNGKLQITTCIRLLAGVLVLGLWAPNVLAKMPDPLHAAVQRGTASSRPIPSAVVA